MKEIYDWDDGCYEKVTHSNNLARNLHEEQHLCNIAANNKEELIEMMPVYESVPHCGKCGYRLQDDWQICPKCKACILWGNKK